MTTGGVVGRAPERDVRHVVCRCERAVRPGV